MAEIHTCKFCGTDFDVHERKDDMGAKLFCSYSCHNKYYRKQRQAKKLAGLNNPDATFMTDSGEHPVNDKPVAAPLPFQKPLTMKELPSKASALSFGSFGPAEQFIIATLQDENNALKAVKEKLKDKVETLTKELADEKQARREDVLKKPSTLEGLSESPVIAQLMPHIGPALGQLLQKFMGGSSVPGIASSGGVSGQQLPEETDKMVSSFVGWFIGLPIELQRMFYGMVHGLAEKSPEDQVKLLEQLSNLVLNNSSFKADYYAA